MTRTRRVAHAAFAAVAVSVVLASRIGAQTGVPIATGPDFRLVRGVFADGAGGVSIVHTQGRRLRHTTFGPDGSVVERWPGGIALVPSGSANWIPSVCSDHAGGFYVAWDDADTVRVQRIDGPTGAVAPGWPAAGVVLFATNTPMFSIRFPEIGVDGTGAVRVFAAVAFDAGGAPLATFTVSPNGTLVESLQFLGCGEGTNLGTVIEAGNQVVVTYDAWTEDHGEPPQGAGHDIGVFWRPASVGHRPGENVAPGTCVRVGGMLYGSVVVPSTGDDVILLYSGPRAQRLRPQPSSYSGGEVWAPGGVLFGSFAGEPLRAAPDGAGGAFITVGEDLFPTTLVLQAIDASGALHASWPNGGVKFDENDGVNPGGIVSDGQGGAIVGWSRGPFNEKTVHGHHVLADGTLDPAWTPDGVELSLTSGTKGSPHVQADGDGGAYFVWATGFSPSAEIYAQHVSHGGQVGPAVGVPPAGAPATLALSPGFPNPTRSSIGFTLTLPEDAHVTARVLDVAGRVVGRVANARMPAGTHALRWNGNGEDGIAAPAGIYLFEVRGGEPVVNRRVVRL